MLIRLIWERALVSVNDAVPRSEIDGKLTNLPTFFICIIELSIGKHFGLLLNLKRECLLLISHGFTLWPELPAWTGAICPTMWWIWAFRAAVQHRTKRLIWYQTSPGPEGTGELHEEEVNAHEPNPCCIVFSLLPTMAERGQSCA